MAGQLVSNDGYTEYDIPVFNKKGFGYTHYIDLKTLKTQIIDYNPLQLLTLHAWAARSELGNLHPYIQCIEKEITRRIEDKSPQQIQPNTGHEVKLHQFQPECEVGVHTE